MTSNGTAITNSALTGSNRDRRTSIFDAIISTTRSLITGVDTLKEEEARAKREREERRRKRRKEKKKIYYATPNQWKITDFWPDDDFDSSLTSVRIKSQDISRSHRLQSVSLVESHDNETGINGNRQRIESYSSSRSSIDDGMSTASGSVCSLTDLENDDCSTVNTAETSDSTSQNPPPQTLDSGTSSKNLNQFDSLHSVENISSQLQQAITSEKVGVTISDSDYCRRARAEANLLTAGIKALVIEEIRADAISKATANPKGKDDALDSLEGKTFRKAFDGIKERMMRTDGSTMGGGKGGIKVFKHARANNSSPRVITMRLKNYLVDIDGHIYDGKGKGKNKKVKRDRRRASKGEESDDDDDDNDDNDDDDDDDDDNSRFDEFGPKSWIEAEPKIEQKVFLTYKGGFMNRVKKRLDLTLLKSVRKGVQTEVLLRCNDNRYRQHAFLSLEFEGRGIQRTFDLECMNGDVELRDKLLHAFKYILLKNEEGKKRLDSWDLDEKHIKDRIHRAWDGRTSSIDKALRDKWFGERKLMEENGQDKENEF